MVSPPFSARKMRKVLLNFIFLVLKVSCRDDESDKSSLVFVFDTTGSMYNDLKQLREGAEMILKTALEEGNVIGDFVFVPFHDPAVGPATVTTDKEAFKRALDSVRVYGGGDCPEKSLTGIQLALNVSAGNSFVYVFTDATAGDHKEVGKVLDSVQRKQSQVVFVLTGHCSDLDQPSYKVYQQIAAASSGQVFNLNKTSVHKVLDFVKSSIKGKMVNLGSSVNPPGHNYTQGIPVDSTLGEVTVSVSGAKPQITVVNPSGEQLTGPPQLVTTLDLSEIMVVKVLQPEPGNWTITVGSEEEYSVKVVGLSNLTFNHGFSVEKPQTVAETSYRPLKGTYNHMMISLTQTDVPVDIEYAEISALNGTTLFEVPLQEIDKENKMYLAEPFIPPEEFFYIAIRGKDQYGQELRRVGTTGVQAKSPDAPYLSAPVKINSHAHSRVVLKCRVESLVPVTAMWTKDTYRIQPKISSLQTTTIEYVIEDMTEEHVGTYRCVASNVAGVSTATTDVTLLVEPPQVTIEPVNATLDIGQTITVTCTVFSEALLTKLHFISITSRNTDVTKVHTEPNIEGIYTFNKTLFNVSENDSGTYKCIAANRGGSSNRSTHIQVQSKPKIQITSPQILHVVQNTTTQLICSATNSNRVQWIAPNTSVVKDVDFIKSGSVNVSLEVNVMEDGIWRCVGRREKLEASDKVEITVQIKPSVTIQGDGNLTVLKGTSHEIVCKVIAKPRPYVQWVRGDDILDTSLTQTSDNVFESALKLNTSINIKGRYVCLAVNPLGTAEDAVDVKVRSNITVLKGLHDSSVQLYSQLEYNCLLDSDPKPHLTWYHNNTVINTDIEQNIHLNDDNTTLYITKVDFSNLGTYMCEANNGYERVTLNGTLRVTGLEHPVLSKTPVEITVKEGDTTVITCRVQKGNPEPSIKWQYKNATSRHFTNLQSSEVETEIVIRNTSKRDAGTYRCVGENVLGNDTYNVKVVVHYAPKFKQEKNKTITDLLEVKSGGLVEFSCETIGLPPPIVTWTKNGLPALFTDNIRVSESNVLTISNVTEYDTGLYICNATSSVGSVQRNFTLFVYEPPKLLTPPSQSPIEVLEGELVELPCKAGGVPKPIMSWTHNDHLLRDDKLYDNGVGLRFIANLTHFGDYTCFAKNKYGNDSTSYTLYIWVPPYITPPTEITKETKTGENVSIECDVIGFPIPTVTWKFKDLVLMENTSHVSFNEVGNLFISNISTNHEGLYTCVAENFAGISNKYIYLNVNESPKILSDNYTGSYVATSMDSALTISCRATGKPKPFVVWISEDHFNLNKDPRYTIEKDGTLTIKSPSEDMSGNYTCIAENTIGKVNKTVSVEIYSLPSQLQSDERHTKVTLVEQSDANIECPFRASNTDTVKWYKDAELISTGNLHISDIRRTNQTTYVCVLSNAVGSAYSTVNIVVEWPPKFIADIEEEENKHENGKSDIKNGRSGFKSGKNEFYDGDGEFEVGKSEFDNGKKDIKMNDELEMLDEEAENLYNGLETFDNEMYTEKSGAKMIDVVKGNDAYLDCRVDAKPLAKMKWLFNAQPILFEDKYRLKLLDVQQSHAGNYKCIVSNIHGTIVKEFNLNVLVPPFISDFDVLDVVFMEGMNATLECNAMGYPEPNIKWSFNNSNWHLEDSTLTANNVTVQFEGIYRCDAKNKAGTSHIVYRVSVVSRAKVVEVVAFMDGQGHGVEGKVEAKLGSNIRIACKASGKPTPIVQWVRNGKILSENSPNIDYADLILDVDANHAGGYTCIASNEGGSDREGVKLYVLEPPKIFRNLDTSSTSSNTINLEIVSGQAFFLHCHPYGSPLPTVYWFKDDLPLKLFDDTMVSTDFNEVIEVRSAVEEQSGNYTCVARNAVGESSVIYLVSVLVPPPTLKESSKPVHIRSGKSLNLTCPIQGSPAPYVMWVKHPYTEVGNDTPRISLFNDNVTLLINRTQVSDSGNYSCIMTNKVGTTEFVFDVSIDKPPSIAGNVGGNIVENHQVAMRRSIVLKCEAEGHPRPKITWLKETQQITGRMSNIHLVLGNSLVTLWGVTSRDAGQYICIAENTAGTDSRRYNVAIIVPGKWSQWGKWSLCNVTCGLGYQHKSRYCQYIDDNNVTYDKTSNSGKIIVDESACKGPSNEKRKCHMPPCEEDSSRTPWSPWSRWSPCSSSCGSGTQARTRRCRTRLCAGDNVQVRKCPSLPPCNDELTSDSNINDADDTYNTYIPEAVFEMKPKMIGLDSTPVDADEFITAGADSALDSPAPEYYDVHVTYNADDSNPGPCSVGFTYNDVTTSCDDIDECIIENNSCHSTQVCVNTEGGYRCSCPAGFVSLGLGQRCLDINECTQELSGCEFACVNVAGGYVCACPADMRLHPDKHHCYTVSELKRPYSNEDMDPEYISTSLDYPARYKHVT